MSVTVWVVDDDRSIRWVLEKALSQEGYAVTCFEDGDEALNTLEQGLALGLIGASAEAGGVIGPLWGGIILRFLNWRWVFWINLPLGVGVLLALGALLGPSPRYRARIDYVGGVLIAVGLACDTEVEAAIQLSLNVVRIQTTFTGQSSS